MMRKPGIVIASHLSENELSKRMKEAESIDQFRRYQVIYLRLTNPKMSLKQVASTCAVAYRTVVTWTWYYNKHGAEKYILSGRGGRRKAHLSEKKELKLLEKLSSKATKGQVITALAVKKAAEKEVGHELPKDYAYDLMHRHNWRKIVPHTHHPKKNAEAQQSFKKTSRPCWLPPEKN
ncbi:MAG: winged helix-turn-helix domain-containing protein [Victivallales bacterium]|nr:winged helix-turn-helix domain-containing protein [Victivallales bacterium]